MEKIDTEIEKIESLNKIAENMINLVDMLGKNNLNISTSAMAKIR